MLLGQDLVQLHRFRVVDSGQDPLIVVNDVVAAFLVHPHEAVKGLDLTGRPEFGQAIRACDVDRGPFEPGTFHLACERPHPNEVVQVKLARVLYRE